MASNAAEQAHAQGLGYQLTAADMLLDIGLRTFFDFVQRTLAAPIDRLMMLTATEGELVRQGRLPPTGFGGVWSCVKRVWRREGFMGFFRGVGADFALSLPSGFVDAASTSAVFSLLQKLLPQRFSDSMTYSQVVLLSMVATSASVAIATPYNALRKSIMTNYMADIVAPISANEAAPTAKGDDGKEASTTAEAADVGGSLGEGYRYATATEAARSIERRHGWAAFYRAAAIDPIVVCAYRGIYVATVALVSPDVQMLYPSAVARGMAVAADLLTQPLEVVSRRLLLTASDSSSVGVQPPYRGPVDCACSIVKNEGVTALWSGLKFRLVSSAMLMALQVLLLGGSGAAAA